MPTASPWRIRDFRTLFAASTLSVLGTNVSYVAMPLLAVLVLDASPGQVGLLAALSTVAFLAIGLPAGAWVDRMRHRRVLIAADLCRGSLLASVPVAWWLDVLTFGQLCAVVLFDGVCTVFFDVTSQSTLPRLVGPASLVPANAALVSLQAAGNVTGRGAGGGLVQLLTAPVALACAAAGHLAAGLQLWRLKSADAAPAEQAGPRAGLRAQISEGLRHVLGDAELRALVLTGTLGNMGSVMVNTMLPVLFVRELALSEGLLGLYWAIGGIGIFAGARCARVLAARLGFGRGLALANLCAAPAALIVPLIGGGGLLWLASAAWFCFMFKTGLGNVLGVSLRQQLTPAGLLGRMNATFRFMFTGSMALAAGAAGLIGEFASLRAVLWTGGVLMALSFLPIWLSPIRRRTRLPEQEQDSVRSPGQGQDFVRSHPGRSARDPSCDVSRLR
ncbi:MFS transporter [Streptomyces indicus]|uniref:Predicted arabinose efflux permease, MFS family n=1 Tax=Streptomyces indicus TaxID=417292 RepID=A0A1G8UJS1_9ACTN|nr:MFS transporter [Streptomyces indicus]SDJ53190.1 Predicted arabinose efflux permease, MFS family [Streptomyces indicus]